MRRLLLLVVVLIVYGSLYPWKFHFQPHHDPFGVLLHRGLSGFTRFDVRDFIVNVLLYFPFGLAACGTLMRVWPHQGAAMLVAVGLGFCLSVSMELLQVYDAGRDSSRFDVESNTLGTVAGALAALLFQPALERLAQRRAHRHTMAGVLLTGCWAGYLFYPFFPVLSTSHLRIGIDRLAAMQGFTPVELWTGIAEWFAAALALASIFGRLPARWLAVAMLALPLRVFVVTRHVDAGELFSGVVVVILWATLPARARLRVGLALILTAILLRELTPFQFLPTPRSFSWIPFYGSFDSEWQSAVVILFRKAFDYGAAVWLLHALGLSYGRAGGVVAVVLLCLETVQRWLPVHVPETTDAVLTLLMALALRALSDSAAEPGLESP